MEEKKEMMDAATIRSICLNSVIWHENDILIKSRSMIQCPFCFAIPTNKKFFSCKNRWERFCQAIKLQILFCHCLIFFFFSSVTRSASTATAAWQVFCLWSLQRFQQGLNVHRWKLFNIWNLKCFLIVQIIHLVWSQGDCDYTSPPFRNLEIEEMIRNYELEVTMSSYLIVSI